jgi:amphi-Trp domain-containing protein
MRLARTERGFNVTSEHDQGAKNMELMELKEKRTLSREDAAARLREIADELASGNDVILERGELRFVARVPDEVRLKIEFEISDEETEFEIELTW